MRRLSSLAAMLLVVLFLATAANGFGIGGNRKAPSSRSSKSSPLLEDALSTYPFIIKSPEERSKMTANFNELARLYGDENALYFVKLEPRTLKFKTENFAPCLDSWIEQFGEERAKAMVKRNPGLLGIPSVLTEDAESSMAFSYLVAAFRPSLPKVVGFVGLLTFGGRVFQEGGGKPF